MQKKLEYPPLGFEYQFDGAGTWLSHLGILRRLHTKLWYALNLSMQHPFGAHIVKLPTSSDLTSGEGTKDGSRLDLQEVAQH